MGRLFGTDGVRGIANEKLDCALAFKLGQAAAKVLTNEVHKAKILIGKDTRISGDMLESALIAGICSAGAEACTLGVIPTSAVAHLTRYYEADAGAVISASHNTVEYNGIKFFNAKGYKLADAIEDEIEKLVLGGIGGELPTGLGAEKRAPGICGFPGRIQPGSAGWPQSRAGLRKRRFFRAGRRGVLPAGGGGPCAL